MRIVSVVFTVAVLLAVVSALNFDSEVLDNKFIRQHNAKSSSWTAGRNARFEGVSVGDVVSMLGTKKPMDTPEDLTDAPVEASIPTSFDARVQWPQCVHSVLNQGQCGSCWAFASSESLSDRLCIASGGKINVTLSPQALVSCDDIGNDGCNGGIPQLAWEYMELKGLPTLGCFPYSSGANGSSPSCQKSCADGSSYTLYRAKPFSMQTCNSITCIQQQVVNYGPAVVTMSVYQDFISYTSGVYVKSPNAQFLGGHAILVVGWGHDQTSGLDYWIIQNSWGTDWGINGYFWIERGTNECSIERDSSASLAKIN